MDNHRGYLCLFSFQKQKQSAPVKLVREADVQELSTSTEIERGIRRKRDQKGTGEGDVDRKKPGSLISDIVLLGYGSLPLTVTVSVETHLQSKSFQKPKQDVPVKKPKWDEPVKLSIEMLKETVERKELSTSTEVEGETREERMIRKTLVKDMRQDTGQVA